VVAPQNGIDHDVRRRRRWSWWRALIFAGERRAANGSSRYRDRGTRGRVILALADTSKIFSDRDDYNMLFLDSMKIRAKVCLGFK
jgi:hypothetical protein